MGPSNRADIESLFLHYQCLSPAEKKAYYRAAVEKATAPALSVQNEDESATGNGR